MKPTLIAIAMLIFISVKGNKYYFSTILGDDARSVIQAQQAVTPWKTIAKFNSLTILKPGDSVLFCRGDVFYGTLMIKSSGSAASPISIACYGTGNNPTISGLKTLSGWTLFSGNTYYVPLDVPSVNLLTINDSVYGMGRYPNSGYLNYKSHLNNSAIVDNKLPGNVNWTGGELVIRKYRWIIDRQTIIKQSGDTLTYNALANYGNNNAYKPVDGNGYFIQNNIQTLDQFGEWYYDPVSKRLYVNFIGGNPNQFRIKVSSLDKNIVISTQTYLNFNNINFEGGNVIGLSLINCKNISLINCNSSFQGGVALYGGTLQNITVQYCNINNSLSNGIWFEYDSNNCTVNNVVISNTNLLAGSGRSGDGVGTGLSITGNHNTISNNKITKSGYNGIHFTGDSILVEKNFVDSFCLIKDDGGGIYSYGNQSVVTNSVVVRSNIVLNAVGAFKGVESYYYEAYGKAAGIYLDGYSNNVQVFNNSIANGQWAGIFVNNNFNHRIFNNTVFNTAKQLYISINDIQTKNLNWKGNIFVAKTQAQSSLSIDTYIRNYISAFGLVDSNYYARPIDDNSIFVVNNNYAGGPGMASYTLLQWQSSFAIDKNSKKSSIQISSVNDILFEYNAGTSNKAILLEGQYVDIANHKYSGSIVLAPFTSTLLFKTPTSSTVKSLSLNGIEQGNGILLRWDAIPQDSNADYNVIKNIATGEKHLIQSVSNVQNNTPFSGSSWFDAFPINGSNSYQVSGIDTAGNILYSSNVCVISHKMNQDIKLFPNPLTGTVLHLRLINLLPGLYTARLVNDAGQIVDTYKLESDGSDFSYTLNINPRLKPGNYYVKVTGKGVSWSKAIFNDQNN